MLLYRDDYYNRDELEASPTSMVEVNVAKNRNGETGVVKLSFERQFTKFKDLEEEFYTDSFLDNDFSEESFKSKGKKLFSKSYRDLN